MIGATQRLSRALCVPVLLSILIMSVAAGGCRPGSNGVAAPESGGPPTGAAEEETAVGPETAESSAPSPEDETAGGPETAEPSAPSPEDETAGGPETAEPSAPSPEDETAGVEEAVDSCSTLDWVEVERDQAQLERLQAEVDDGHKVGNCDVQCVAFDFVDRNLGLSGLCSIEATSVHVVVVTKKGRLHLLMDRPVRQDRTGILSVKSYAWEE